MTKLGSRSAVGSKAVRCLFGGAASVLAVLALSLSMSELAAGETDGGVRFERKAHAGATFQIVWADPKKASIRLRWKDAKGTPIQTLEGARDLIDGDGQRFFFATNAGIYDRAFEPLGLHVENGRELKRLSRVRGPRGNFFMQPNGVFFVKQDGTAAVLDSASYAQSKPDAAFASQSGPLLVGKGEFNPNFSADSENRKLRSGVGVDGRGWVAFAISERRTTFQEFAALFRDALGCPNALYLDGEISAFLRGREVATQFAPFVGIWTISGPKR